MKTIAKKKFTVSRKDYEEIIFKRVPKYIIHGRKGLKVVPDSGRELDDDRIIFTDGPKIIEFRKRWSTEKGEREVRHIIADRSDRFDLKFIIYFR